MQRQQLLIVGALLVLCNTTNTARADLPEGNLEFLHQLILPGKNDSQWMNVSWFPATNIWAAREKAAKEGKPILLWYMAGEPLGPC